MSKISLKPTHKVITEYHTALHSYSQLGFFNEGSVSPPFATLLESSARQLKWNLIQQYPKKSKGKSIRIDGAVVDQWGLPHGYWEAKDSKDDLRKEVKNKFAVGYPRENIIFQEPAKAILWQNEREIAEFDLLKADELVRLLELFFDYVPPAFEEWEEAAKKFHEQLPELGDALLKVLDDAKVNNKAFQTAFAAFYELCRTSINPNLSEKAVEEMLIQHLLTERIFRTVFQNSEFTQRNAIAKEIETVIRALTSQSFSREEFLKRFDHFYRAIEQTASTIDSFPEKQTFLNNIYERFFQGFSVDVADTHGIVYTPQPIVNFMVKSVEDILQKEFGKSLSDENVHILDPFVGTGNFMVHIIDEIKKTSLERKYANELHCNEVMLLPYYIASMNIEHEYFEKVGRYVPFEGICLVDTFDMTERQQSSFSFMTEENSARIERQKQSPITVVIGNPPYNVGQINENDNNRNRKYPVIDARVAETYSIDSKAINKNALSDPYVKAIRWATDRIAGDGVIALVTNNGFLNGIAFDGMRKHLEKDFSKIYHVDLKGNARTTGERRRKEGGNVFGNLIRVGVGITFFVKHSGEKTNAEIHVFSIDDYFKAPAKQKFLDTAERIQNVRTKQISPDAKHTWLTEGIHLDFDGFLSIGNRDISSSVKVKHAVFESYSRGVETTRDDWVFNFNEGTLMQNVEIFIDNYNGQVNKWRALKREKTDLESFISRDDKRIKWNRLLKQKLSRGDTFEVNRELVRRSIYRPFTKEFVYFSKDLIYLPGIFPRVFPQNEIENENVVICVVNEAQIPFSAQITNVIPALHYGGRQTQCFPFFTYQEDGTNRRENITDWALEQFREYYKSETRPVGGEVLAKSSPPGQEGWQPVSADGVVDLPESGINPDKDLRTFSERTTPSAKRGHPSFSKEGSQITKWDIFYYTYAILHHPEYREKYAANLKRELPRIPFARDFWSFAKAGKELAYIHVNYEASSEYKLDMIENAHQALDWCVEKMRYNKDKTAIIYNDFLTMDGIPPEAHEYRLGNRSALDWIVDQYKVSIDKRSGITNDPNRDNDPQYIVRLVKKIVTVSLKTNEIVRSLPDLV